ncbi:MAG: hypothetical protein IKQ85_06585, partial [Bacteroidaceae bacterium]|nr:hypothetical protein [Bacteroidaceae bacterium]
MGLNRIRLDIQWVTKQQFLTLCYESTIAARITAKQSSESGQKLPVGIVKTACRVGQHSVESWPTQRGELTDLPRRDAQDGVLSDILMSRYFA